MRTLLFPLNWLLLTMQILYRRDQLEDMITDYEVMRAEVGIHGMHYDTECFELFQDIQSMRKEIDRLEWTRKRL